MIVFYNNNKNLYQAISIPMLKQKKENKSNFFEVDPIVGCSTAHTENIFPFPEPSLYMDLHTDAIS